MEYLEFNSGSQWSLNKTSDPTKRNFNDYHSANRGGELPVDRGTKGHLGYTQNTKRANQMSPEKMDRKMPTPKISSYHSRHPSLEDDSSSPKLDRI